MVASDLAHDVHLHFLAHDFQWKKGDDTEVPSPEEIQVAIDWLRENLKDEPDGTAIWGGRLVASKTEGHLDLFVHFGEIND